MTVPEMTGANDPVVVGSVLFTDLVGFTEYNEAVGDIEAFASSTNNVRSSTGISTAMTPGWSRRSAMA